MESPKSFKEIESDAVCPPHLQNELVSEIDLIRNAITLIDVYVGNLFDLVTTLVNPSQISQNDTQLPHETAS